jgi:hypothetical protein
MAGLLAGVRGAGLLEWLRGLGWKMVHDNVSGAAVAAVGAITRLASSLAPCASHILMHHFSAVSKPRNRSHVFACHSMQKKLMKEGRRR